MQIQQPTAFEQRRRRTVPSVAEESRYVPHDERVLRQLYVVESQLLAEATGTAPDALLFTRFWLAQGTKYGGFTVRAGLLAAVAALGCEATREGLLERVAQVVAELEANRESFMLPSRFAAVFLTWSLSTAAPIEALTGALSEFREQHRRRGDRWLHRLGLLVAEELYAQPRAPRSLSMSAR